MPKRVDSQARPFGLPSRRLVSRALLGAGLAGGLRSLTGRRDVEGKKKRKKCKKKQRCLSGEIRVGTKCATLCEVNEDCGGPPVYCHSLGDFSARVCIISDGVDWEDMPQCPSRSAAECPVGRICYEFAMAPVCGRPM